jgi:YVTN family beta-propeller protein
LSRGRVQPERAAPAASERVALSKLRASLLILALLCSGFSLAAGAGEKPEAGAEIAGRADSDTRVEKGLRIEFSVNPVPGRDGGTRPVTEGDDAEVVFRVTDAATGAPVSPLKPAVWIDRLKGDEEAAGKPLISCRDRVNRYLQGTLAFQPDVNLNKFFILVMNNDHSISVIDPIVDVGGITQLYAMILLKNRGEDWVASEDGKQLFVTMPEAGAVAAVDLDSFKVARNAAAGTNPSHIALQPDGKYLWVGNDGPAGGVTVLDAATLAPAAFIPTGAGRHEIAFPETSRFAYVTNSEANTLSVIDTQQLKKIADLPAGDRPVAVAFSSLGKAIYVANAGGGVAVVDTARNAIASRVETAPGLTALRFAPGGRWGFVANGSRNEVYILDASSGSLAHTVGVGDRPQSFAFTTTFAYVRCSGTAEVTLIQLSDLANHAAFSRRAVSFGTRAPGDFAFLAADALSPTGEWDTMLIASPAEGLVYYYMEGMVAPMGSFPTYGRVPRAVRVVDRSLKEVEKGVYAAKFRVPLDGKYEVAMVIDSPWVYDCFEFSAAVDPGLASARAALPPKLEFLTRERRFPAGQPLRLRFTLLQQPGGEPLSGVSDVVVLAAEVPGRWQSRQFATPLAAGSYEAIVSPDRPGRYSVFIKIPSRRLEFNEFPTLFLEVTAGKQAEEPR